MKTKLIQLPDYNIIISDEEIEKGDLMYNSKYVEVSKHNGMFTYGKEDNEFKIIASENPEHNLPSIDYNGLEEKFGIVDIKKLAKELNPMNGDNWQMNSIITERRRAFIEGFKKAQELNDKKFSKKEMEKCFIAGGKMARNIENPSFDEFIESLQKPKVIDVEIEIEQINNKHNSPSYSVETQYKPKITNNKIKILNIL